MARLTIVIPCLETGEAFESTLVSVLQNRPDDCEVVVVHAGPYGDPYDLGNEVRFLEARADATHLELANLGWTESTSEVIHFLVCGTQVDDGWTERCLAHFERASIGSVAPLVIPGPENPKRRIAGVRFGSLGRKLVYRSRSAKDQTVSTILGPSLTAAFYRREALEEAGGFDVVVGDRCGDADIALALDDVGYDSLCEPSSTVTVHCVEGGRSGFSDARRSERLFWKHRRSEDGFTRVVWHLAMVAAEFLFPFPGPVGVARLLGRLVGSLEPRIRRRSGLAGKRSRQEPSRPALFMHQKSTPERASSESRPKRRRSVA